MLLFDRGFCRVCREAKKCGKMLLPIKWRNWLRRTLLLHLRLKCRYIRRLKTGIEYLFDGNVKGVYPPKEGCIIHFGRPSCF